MCVCVCVCVRGCSVNCSVYVCGGGGYGVVWCAQSCLTLCDSIDSSSPGSPGELPFPPLEDLPDLGSLGLIQTCISFVSCFTGRFFTTEPPGKPGHCRMCSIPLALYPLDASSNSHAATTKNISRYFQMSPGEQNCPWLRA